jgi:hypothetical protein
MNRNLDKRSARRVIKWADAAADHDDALKFIDLIVSLCTHNFRTESMILPSTAVMPMATSTTSRGPLLYEGKEGNNNKCHIPGFEKFILEEAIEHKSAKHMFR